MKIRKEESKVHFLDLSWVAAPVPLRPPSPPQGGVVQSDGPGEDGSPESVCEVALLD